MWAKVAPRNLFLTEDQLPFPTVVGPLIQGAFMQLTKTLYRKSAFVLGVFLLFALFAFWPGYFHNPFSVPDYHIHVHGIIATSWCVLLVVQAYLIRSKNRDLHRRLGKLSYVLAPLVFLSTVSVYQNLVQGNEVTVSEQMFAGLVFGEVTLFALMYGLAIYHRDTPTVHARYMVCTPLPMIPPIFNRILGTHYPEVFQIVPTIDGHEIPQGVTVPATLLIIAGLLIWDWRSHNRLDVFPVVLILFILFEGLSFLLYRVPIWGSFLEWFFGLPLP